MRDAMTCGESRADIPHRCYVRECGTDVKRNSDFRLRLKEARRAYAYLLLEDEKGNKY